MRCTGGPGTSDPGTLTCENYSLSFLVMMAYNLRSFELTAPDWMDTAPIQRRGEDSAWRRQAAVRVDAAEAAGRTVRVEGAFQEEGHDGLRADGD
jgi:hypothetical protein